MFTELSLLDGLAPEEYKKHSLLIYNIFCNAFVTAPKLPLPGMADINFSKARDGNLERAASVSVHDNSRWQASVILGDVFKRTTSNMSACVE